MTFDETRRACYASYVVQAIVNNLVPLLFIVFQTRYDVSLEMLGRLVLLNFATQVLTDLVALRYVDRVGYRVPTVLAHVLCTAGLVLLAVLPGLLPSAYAGLVTAVVVYAVGGGLLEVVVSPIIEGLPTPPARKASAMSLLHSFYCWGQAGVVAGTTLLLALVGHGSWQLLPLAWAVFPFFNLLMFLRVPLPETVPEASRLPLSRLFRARDFGLVLVLMLTAGATELTMSQWSSLFAEQALEVPKAWGDLAGPFLFAVLMGTGRVAYGLWGERIPLIPAILGCGGLAIACYLVTALARDPVLSLAGCALTGLAVSLLWPGSFSLAAARFPLGGAAMFGMLAVFGDLGGSIGPWAAGYVADLSQDGDSLAGILPEGDGFGLRAGVLFGTIFPVVMVLTTLYYGWRTRAAQ